MDDETDSQQPQAATNQNISPAEAYGPAAPKGDKAKCSQCESSNGTNPANNVRKITWLEYVLAATNVSLVAVGIWALTVYKGQLTVMQGTLDQIKVAATQTDKIIRESAKQSNAARDSAIAAQDSVIITSRQMRQDQRPWITLKLTPDPDTTSPPPGKFTLTINVGQKPVIMVRYMNTGKTPARGIKGVLALETIETPDEFYLPPDMTNPPKISHPKHFIVTVDFQSGVVFPNEPHDIPATRPNPLTRSELDKIVNGSMRLMVAGTVKYSDEFGLAHWTNFCKTVNIAEIGRCVHYNDADQNY